MYLFLQIDSQRAIGPDDLVRTYAGSGGNVAAGVRNADVGRVIVHNVLCALHGRGREFTQELLPESSLCLGLDSGRNGERCKQSQCQHWLSTAEDVGLHASIDTPQGRNVSGILI